MFIPALNWNTNPKIIIPALDSISIKSILYGSCLFCLSSNPPFNYRVEIHFVANNNEQAALTVNGLFASGGIHSVNRKLNGIEAKNHFQVNGQKIEAQKSNYKAILFKRF